MSVVSSVTLYVWTLWERYMLVLGFSSKHNMHMQFGYLLTLAHHAYALWLFADPSSNQ